MVLDRDLVATALPQYDVAGELGRGAWGVVLSGRHRELGRTVAIKQLPRAFGADPGVHARFVREARILASLDHPHIVPIYDFVEHSGLCLLVMEHLSGGTLWSRFQRRDYAPQWACAVVLAVAAAAHHAHVNGVLHRDLKPDNIMFSSDGTVKTTDFGIAKVLGGSSTLATRAGEVLGTPMYMAPEQATSGELGPATDVYALATVLFELLAGCLPFPDESNPIAVLDRRLHEAPRSLHDAAPALPVEVCRVVDRALGRAMAQRPADAELFGAAVAGAASRAWGASWLSQTGVELTTTGPVLHAATGDQSSRATDVSGRPSTQRGSWPAVSAHPPAGYVAVDLRRDEV